MNVVGETRRHFDFRYMLAAAVAEAADAAAAPSGDAADRCGDASVKSPHCVTNLEFLHYTIRTQKTSQMFFKTFKVIFRSKDHDTSPLRSVLLLPLKRFL